MTETEASVFQTPAQVSANPIDAEQEHANQQEREESEGEQEQAFTPGAPNVEEGLEEQVSRNAELESLREQLAALDEQLEGMRGFDALATYVARNDVAARIEQIENEIRFGKMSDQDLANRRRELTQGGGEAVRVTLDQRDYNFARRTEAKDAATEALTDVVTEGLALDAEADRRRAEAMRNEYIDVRAPELARRVVQEQDRIRLTTLTEAVRQAKAFETATIGTPQGMEAANARVVAEAELMKARNAITKAPMERRAEYKAALETARVEAEAVVQPGKPQSATYDVPMTPTTVPGESVPLAERYDSVGRTRFTQAELEQVKLIDPAYAKGLEAENRIIGGAS